MGNKLHNDTYERKDDGRNGYCNQKNGGHGSKNREHDKMTNRSFILGEIKL